MHPRFVEHRSFHVVGMRERLLPGEIARIPGLWDRFVARRDEIPARVGHVQYAVCVDDTKPGAPGFTYMPCVEVASLGQVPEGMTGLTVAGGRYAVFTHRGPISGMEKTVVAVWKEWLPAAGLRPTGAPDFERYDERFRGEDAESEVDLYIPVTERSPSPEAPA